MKYELIADSGSTKTDWIVLVDGCRVQKINTQGINPYMLDQYQIVDLLKNELLPRLITIDFESIAFYGAGCRGDHCVIVESALRRVFRIQNIFVASDMLGAARILCGNKEGIVCILGTGSNSCLYDGEKIVDNVSPLGFILGDEGSGAVLGRRLLGDILKKQLPEKICKAFFKTYFISLDEIIRNVYRETFANRFLASFCPFIHKHRKTEEVHEMVVDEFVRFFKRNVANYSREDLPVHFVGSIAFYFEEELKAAAEKAGFKIGTIQKSPLDDLGMSM